MANGPELQIVYDARGLPLSARCSVCKSEMRSMKAGGASLEQLIKWLSIQFALHKRKHHKRDVHVRDD
jgi:hypothetical protein